MVSAFSCIFSGFRFCSSKLWESTKGLGIQCSIHVKSMATLHWLEAQLPILYAVTEDRNIAQRIHFQISAVDPNAWIWEGYRRTNCFSDNFNSRLIWLASYSCFGVFSVLCMYCPFRSLCMFSCNLLTLSTAVL